ncbi:hypothetical protein D3C73_771260 [compost metagenome]
MQPLSDEYERRHENGEKSLVGLSFIFEDEVRDLDYQTACSNDDIVLADGRSQD